MPDHSSAGLPRASSRTATPSRTASARDGTADRLEHLAEETFGWSRLRPEQLTAMRQVLHGRDALVVMPTGSGKSAVYQVPTLLLPGPTVVVSPLVALQRDQIGQLDDSAAPRAVAVNSAQPARDTERAWAALAAGEAGYLFLSPEQLAKEDVLDRLRQARPSLFVVDEAHCVSDWGHDFRPDYLRLRHAIERVGRPTVLAMTATASRLVRDDIVDQLDLRGPVRIVTGFDRPNLYLAVRQVRDDDERRAAVSDWIAEAAKPGLVYTATRAGSETYADDLGARGVRVEAFHAGLGGAERQRIQDAFMAGELDVVVATSAFGMGIDKPDVRFVVHTAPPDSLDSYYQQIGRAGRDGERADAVLFHRPEDLSLQRFLTSRTLDPDKVREVATAVREHDGSPSPSEIDDEVEQSHRSAMNNLNLLEQADVVVPDDRGGFTYRDDRPDPERAAAREFEKQRQLDRSRTEVLREYAQTRSCRRQFLLGYFGEALEQPCGFCDTCDEGTARRHAPPAGEDNEFPVGTRVRHPEWGPGTVVNQESDRLTVLFDDAGYRTLSLPVVQENDLLGRAW